MTIWCGEIDMEKRRRRRMDLAITKADNERCKRMSIEAGGLISASMARLKYLHSVDTEGNVNQREDLLREIIIIINQLSSAKRKMKSCLLLIKGKDNG